MIKILLFIVIAILLSSCAASKRNASAISSLDKILESKGAPAGLATSIFKVADSIANSLEDITPQQEYYIGRSVAVNLLGRYRIYNNKNATEYINKIGLLLTYQSDVPTLYGGYHFVILDSDEINAFAAPGGFIFVTRGILRCAKSEDAVAAILAHEISHLTNRHGMRSIKSSRWSDTGVLLAAESAKKYMNNDQLQSLVDVFQGSITDVVNTLVVSGYSRSYELEADKTASLLLSRTGYNPSALVDMLKVMDKQLISGSKDFSSTHPKPSDRIAELDSNAVNSVEIPQKRMKRFRLNLAKI